MVILDIQYEIIEISEFEEFFSYTLSRYLGIRNLYLHIFVRGSIYKEVYKVYALKQ